MLGYATVNYLFCAKTKNYLILSLSIRQIVVYFSEVFKRTVIISEDFIGGYQRTHTRLLYICNVLARTKGCTTSK